MVTLAGTPVIELASETRFPRTLQKFNVLHFKLALICSGKGKRNVLSFSFKFFSHNLP